MSLDHNLPLYSRSTKAILTRLNYHLLWCNKDFSSQLLSLLLNVLTVPWWHNACILCFVIYPTHFYTRHFVCWFENHYYIWGNHKFHHNQRFRHGFHIIAFKDEWKKIAILFDVWAKVLSTVIEHMLLTFIKTQVMEAIPYNSYSQVYSRQT